MSKLGLEFTFYIALALGLYAAGARHGRNAATLAQLEAHRATVMDTVRVVERRLVVDTQRVRVTAHAAAEQRAAFDSSAKAVTALADSQPATPIALALPAIHLCQQTIAADTVAYAAVVATLGDMTTDRDAQRARAEDDERELKLSHPRFGFRSGLAVGAAVVAAVVHFLR
ncbi:MAG TPA: hypothetical protein VFZ98_00065 [Vicinamibacterales bacterium]